jgi:Uma2 family endonuclease
MSVGRVLSVEEYLNTSYSPDMEYRDGVLVARNVGEEKHSFLQIALGAYVHHRRREWRIRAYTELPTRVRETWCPIPDLCIYPEAGFEGRYPTVPPILWVEILSPDDRMSDVWKKITELLANGVPNVWIIDPETLESELWTAAGNERVVDKTLRLPNTRIVIPLLDVIED